jgi:hypothetical protein
MSDDIIIPSLLYALTLHRPWTDAILYGGKRIENRSWKPHRKVLGKIIGLHAARFYDVGGARWMLNNTGFFPPLDEDSPERALVGLARVTGYVTTSDDVWFGGPIGWTMDDICRLNEPIMVLGMQGLWSVGPLIREKIERVGWTRVDPR